MSNVECKLIFGRLFVVFDDGLFYEKESICFSYRKHGVKDRASGLYSGCYQLIGMEMRKPVLWYCFD